MTTSDTRLWHPWLRIQRLLRDMVDSASEAPSWRAVQRAAWATLRSG